jgi:spermidine/putrescine transport system permease protein
MCQCEMFKMYHITISTLIGTFGAIAIYHLRHKQFKVTLLTLNNVLMVSSDVVIGASFLINIIVVKQQ